MIAHLFKPRRRRAGKLVVTKTWHVRRRLQPGHPVESRNLGVRDRQVAQQKLVALVAEAEREAAGILGPRPLRDAAAMPVAEQLFDSLVDLEARGRTEQYVYDVRLRLARLADVTAEAFVNWRSSRPRDTRPSKRGRGPVLSAKTLNGYLALAAAWLNWMRRHGRLAANPLAAVRKVEACGMAAFTRRPLTEAEAAALVSRCGPRSAIDMTALMTGLRRGELRQLRWQDVDPQADPQADLPRIAARAATTKNRKDATLLLRGDLAAALGRLRPAAATGRVFAKLPTMEQFRADRSAAGSACRDPSGRVVDFHALRHTFATHLARGKVSPAVAMRMMRHSDPRLTLDRYTDPAQLPYAAAREALLRYGDAGEDTQKDAPVTAQTGPAVSRPVRDGRGLQESQPPHLKGLRCGGSGLVVTRPGGSKQWAIQDSNL